MEEWIKCKVIMLPTDKAEKCIILDHHSYKVRGFMFWLKSFLTNMYCIHSEYFAYHLYVLSDETPEIGDYAVTSLDGGKTKTIIKVVDEFGVYNGYCKVIATTDLALNLSRLTSEFLKIYIDSYNLHKVITDILVMYVDSIPYAPIDTININTIKELWNRNEVIQKFYELLKATGSEIRAEMKGIGTSHAYIEYSGDDLEEWMSKNL